MLPELGHFALVLALLLAGLQAFFGILGPALGRDRWVVATTSAVAGQFVMVAMAVGVLVYAFVNFDFSVLYVAENSNSALPLMYRIAALWGAHEGSTAAVDLPAGRVDARGGDRLAQTCRRGSRHGCWVSWACSVSVSCCSRSRPPTRSVA